VFSNNNLLVKTIGDTVSVPTFKDLEFLKNKFSKVTYMGDFDKKACFYTEIKDDILLNENLILMSIRDFGLMIEKELFFIVGKAYQLLDWDKKNKFCGICGSETLEKDDERAKLCPKCGSITYPRISPAIIVAITKEDKILLAHNKNFPKGFYSVLAGFVEPGETLEQCVKREIYEEVGIHVKNIKYFGNQPWSFPDSLMIAFTAEYDSGEISADDFEIEHADWFSVDELPEALPKKISIANRLIANFIEQMKKRSV
jgi:NAD+ diphosphatase